jgi:hypothetical protein
MFQFYSLNLIFKSIRFKRRFVAKNDLKKAIIKKNTKKKKHETTMVAALSWVKHHQYSTSWTAITSLYRGEQ